MTLRTRSTLAASLLLAVAALPAAAAGPVDRWLVADSDGPVTLLPPYGDDSDGWGRVRTGDPVPDLGRLRTGPRARVTLSDGGHVVDVGPDTGVELPPPPADGLPFELYQGSGSATYRFATGATAFDVVTPHLVVVGPGATFTVAVRDGDASVVVERGAIRVESRYDGSTARSGPGRIVRVGPPADGGIAIETLSARSR